MTLKDRYKLWLKQNRGLTIVLTITTLFFLLALASTMSQAADRTINCDPPTQRADGTPLTPAEIANYEWWVDGQMDGTSTACQYVLSRPDGSYNVQAKTVDTGGRVSVASPAVNFTLTTANPNPPTNLR